MQHLEVSSALRHIYVIRGLKVKIPITYFSPIPCYPFPLRHKYLFKPLLRTFLPPCKTKCHTHTKQLAKL